MRGVKARKTELSTVEVAPMSICSERPLSQRRRVAVLACSLVTLMVSASLVLRRSVTVDVHYVLFGAVAGILVGSVILLFVRSRIRC
jgi:membrane protein YdbS with pleckstrin-like domain